MDTQYRTAITAEAYADLVYTADAVGLIDAYSNYKKFFKGEDAVERYSLLLKKPGQYVKTIAGDCYVGEGSRYSELMEQAETNEWGAGMTITKAQVIKFLKKGLPAGFEIMCKEYGDDEDWNGVYADDLDTLEADEENEYQTFSLVSDDCVTYAQPFIAKLDMAISIRGASTSDFIFALDESVRLIKEGYLSGSNSNDTGRFNFDVKLDDSCNECGNPFVD